MLRAIRAHIGVVTHTLAGVAVAEAVFLAGAVVRAPQQGAVMPEISQGPLALACRPRIDRTVADATALGAYSVAAAKIRALFDLTALAAPGVFTPALAVLTHPVIGTVAVLLTAH